MYRDFFDDLEGNIVKNLTVVIIIQDNRYLGSSFDLF